jgi:hypothetical protein
MQIVPLSLKAANSYILANHRHHGKVQGHKFSVGLQMNGELVGCAVVGRPIARMLDDGLTAEVTRLCTDGTRNACSKLYTACQRIAAEMGYRKIVTYILASESGVSLKGAGWTQAANSSGGTWSRTSRLREDKHPLDPKVRWDKDLNP